MKTFAIIFTVLFLIGCSGGTGKQYVIVVDADEAEGIGWGREWQLELDVRDAIDDICAYLEIESADTVRVYISNERSNEASKLRMNLYKLSTRNTELIYYLTTIALTGYKGGKLYKEGLAVYMSDRFGTFKKEGRTLEEYLRKYRHQFHPLTFIAENDSVFYSSYGRYSQMAYAQAGGFAKFLNDKYGRQNLIEFHRGWAKDIEAIYGKSLIELEQEWLTHLFPPNPTDTLSLR